MPGISVSKIPIPFRGAGGISWQTYWTTHSPSGLVVTTYDTSIKLDWTDGAEAPDGIRIYVDSVEVDTVAHGVQTYTITGLTELTEYDISVVGYSGSNESTALTNTTTTYRYRYVRPLGGDYGAEDGSSYAAAWDGFADITWAEIVPNTVLWVCGTHNETLDMGASGTAALHIQVRGDYAGDAGIIDGTDTLVSCMNNDTHDYIEYHYMEVCNAATTVINNNGGAHIWHYHGHYYDSGDQVTEQNSNVTVVYENCEIYGGADDGLSMHSGARVTLQSCYVHDNDQNIQSSGGVYLRAYDTRFSNGGSGNVSIDLTDCIISRCKFTGAIRSNLNGVVSYSLFDGCTVGSSLGLAVDNCTFTIGLGLTTATITYRNCIIYNFVNINDTDIVLNNCNLCGSGTMTVGGNTNEVYGLPDFTDYNNGDYTLRPTSPLLTSGVNLGYNLDLAGNAVPSSGIALGCYQVPSEVQSNPSVNYFDILSAGTGLVLSEIRLKSNAKQTITLTGNAKFYTDLAGTLGESSTWDISANTLETRYIKLTAGVERLWFDGSKIIAFGGIAGTSIGYKTVANSPRVFCDLSNFASTIESIWIAGTGNYTFGNIGSYTSLVKFQTGDGIHKETGNITNHTSLETLSTPAPLSGDVGLANMVNGITCLILNHCAMDTYTNGATWSNAVVRIDPLTGYGYSQTEVGNILIDMNASASGPASKAIKLTGANASMADTNQGGIWGDFDGETTPSTLAIAYKNMIRVKSNTLTLNGITVPGVSGDGTGFPAGFGDWYRS